MHRCLGGQVTPTLPTSVRYPYPVRDLADLLREMLLAARLHGRIGCCGWIVGWLPGRPIVRWDEATRMVSAVAKGKHYADQG